MKHIYKQGIETEFFQLLIAKNEITKGNSDDGTPTIVLEEENSTTIWSYETDEQRDNDYDIVILYRNKV